jgi:hypothetical protein
MKYFMHSFSLILLSRGRKPSRKSPKLREKAFTNFKNVFSLGQSGEFSLETEVKAFSLLKTADFFWKSSNKAFSCAYFSYICSIANTEKSAKQ